MKSWPDCDLPDNGLFPDRYLLRDIVSEGSNSFLLLAYDREALADVIIKCFKPDAKGAYLREIGAAFGLSHPNLVSCLDSFYRADGIACIVYEYVSGGSLTDLLERQTLSTQTIITCLRDLLEALVYLHGQNRIHCDIKPDNIMRRPSAELGQEQFVLIDFGAACFLREAQEGWHSTGTPAYIAPERLKNKFFFNSDLYSLGVLAFEMSVGHRPFSGTLEELTEANLSLVPSLEAIKPPELRDFIDHLLVKNPALRWADAKLTLVMLNKIAVALGGVQEIIDPATSVDGLLALHSFCERGQPRVGLVYQHFMDIVDLQQPHRVLQTFLTQQPINILGDDCFAYATPSRIQIVALGSDEATLVHEGLQQVLRWHFGYGRLLWGNTYFYFYSGANDKKVARFSLPNYLFGPHLDIMEDGSFLTTEGVAKNTLVWRDANTKPLKQWELTGTIIAIGHKSGYFLVVTLELTGDKSHALWSWRKQGQPQKHLLDGRVRQIMLNNGRFYWLCGESTVYGCDKRLQPEVAAEFPCGITQFSVVFRHDWLIGMGCDNQNPMILTLLKNRIAV